jgi:hypothetical protein
MQEFCDLSIGQLTTKNTKKISKADLQIKLKQVVSSLINRKAPNVAIHLELFC